MLLLSRCASTHWSARQLATTVSRLLLPHPKAAAGSPAFTGSEFSVKGAQQDWDRRGRGPDYPDSLLRFALPTDAMQRVGLSAEPLTAARLVPLPSRPSPTTAPAPSKSKRVTNVSLDLIDA